MKGEREGARGRGKGEREKKVEAIQLLNFTDESVLIKEMS